MWMWRLFKIEYYIYDIIAQNIHTMDFDGVIKFLVSSIISDGNTLSIVECDPNNAIDDSYNVEKIDCVVSSVSSSIGYIYIEKINFVKLMVYNTKIYEKIFTDERCLDIFVKRNVSKRIIYTISLFKQDGKYNVVITINIIDIGVKFHFNQKLEYYDTCRFMSLRQKLSEYNSLLEISGI